MQYRFPFITTAKVRARCAETGRAIRKGDTIAFYPVERISYHESSQHFADVLAFYAFEPEGVAHVSINP